MMFGRLQLLPLLACLLLACLYPRSAKAQEKRYANGLYLERFSLKEGLPSQTTYCLVAGRQTGVLWMGSNFGMVQYDGYAFTLFPFSDASLPLAYGDMNHLCEGPGGNLWFTIANRADIFLFEPGAGAYRYYADTTRDGAQPRRKTALAADGKGGLWIGDAATGLYHFQPKDSPDSVQLEGKLLHFPAISEDGNDHSAGPLSNTIHALLLHPNGDLWIATDKGLSRMRAGQQPETGLRFSHYHQNSATPIRLEAATALAPAASGGLWVAERGKGPGGAPANAIEYFSHSTGKFQPVPTELTSRAFISSLLESENGQLYIGTLGDALYILPDAAGALAGKPGQAKNYKFEPRSTWSNDYIVAITQGRFKNIWIATGISGLYKVNPYFNQFSHFKAPLAPAGDGHYFTCAAEGPGGKVWITSSSSGVYCYDRRRNTFRHFLPEEGNPYSLASKTVTSVSIDRDSNVWLGTTAGPNRYEPETGRFIRYPEPRGFILCMYEDGQGYRWFGTIGGGITILDSAGQFVARYRHSPDAPKSLIHNNVWQIYEDSRGDIYIPTSGGLSRVIRNGPLRVDSLQFEQIPTPHSFITWMHESQTGHYWLSYLGYGLYRWDTVDNSFRENELPSDMANVILEDGRGRLWLIASGGVYCFDPETETLQSYEGSYGFPFASLGRFGRQNARGEITLSAGEFGFTIFHPDSIRANSVPPVVMITGLYTQKGGSESTSLLSDLKEPEKLSLPYSKNSITIEYKAIHLSQPGLIRYAYRLQGLDEGWIDAGQSRVARYSKIPSGQYAFQVKAVSADGVWSEIATSSPIRIAPPWWRSTGAYVAYALLLAGAIASYTRFQRRRWKLESELALEQQKAAQLQELDDFKSRFFTNITHEFRTPLTIILGMADQIRIQPQKLLGEGLDMITRNGKTLLRLVNQMLDLAKVESGKLKANYIHADIIPFLKYITDSFHSHAESRNIELSFHSDREAVFMDFDPDIIQKVCANLISNAIKFSLEGGIVKIEAGTPKRKAQPAEPQRQGGNEKERNGLAITVTDTGIGIPKEKLPYIFDRFYSSPGPPQSPRGEEVARESLSSEPPSETPPPLEGAGGRLSPLEGVGGSGAGAGIGLALTKELVELMSGTLTVKSEPGKGTAFTVILPITRNAKIQATPTAWEAGDTRISWPEPKGSGKLGGRTASVASGLAPHRPLLLIVEDNPDVRRYLKTLLEGRYTIRTAPDGEKGVEVALEIVPDLIISDVMMPKKDGFELCRALKTDRRTSHIPIILLTAKADVDSRLTGLSQGADAYLAKPFNQRELDIQLQNALELRRALQKKYSGWGYQLPAAQDEDSPDAQFLHQAREAIEKNLDNPDFDIAELQQALGVSRTQCFRKFRALVDATPSEFLRRRRLEHARALLANNNLSISQVAYQSGFRDPANFSRLFRKAFGMSPSEFRAGGKPDS